MNKDDAALVDFYFDQLIEDLTIEQLNKIIHLLEVHLREQSIQNLDEVVRINQGLDFYGESEDWTKLDKQFGNDGLEDI